MRHQTRHSEMTLDIPSDISASVPELRDHCDEVVRYLVRRVEPDQVIDALADVAAVASGGRRRTSAGDGLLELYSIARDVVRVRGVRPVADSTHPTTGRERCASDEDHELLAAVEGLDEPERELLRLRAWERLTVPETAEVMGLSERAVCAILDDVGRRLRLPAGRQGAGELDDSMWMPAEGTS